MINLIKRLLLILCCFYLIACGGSGQGSSDGSNSQDQHNQEDDLSDDAEDSGECVLTQDEQEMLDLINTARSQARDCGDTSHSATSSVVWNCTLEAVAQGHSDDMAENNFFSHTGSDGLSVANRVTNAGYFYSMVGENIAAGQITAASVMQSWINSPGHCANIMNSRFSEVGVVKTTPTQAYYSTYWTQVFATER